MLFFLLALDVFREPPDTMKTIAFPMPLVQTILDFEVKPPPQLIYEILKHGSAFLKWHVETLPHIHEQRANWN